MQKSLNIVITGASRGIGYQVAKQLAGQGHSLFCVSRNKGALQKLKQECLTLNHKANIEILGMDITELTNNTYDLCSDIKEVFPRVDVLLNNAGILINKNFAEFSFNESARIFNLNFFAVATVIQQLLPVMGGEQISHIVNIGSMGGYQGSSKFPGLSYYSASKAALSCLSECLAEELKDSNIKVNCLALGAAQTEMLNEAFPGYKAPLSGKEMAEFISYFMISGHTFFNGKVLPVAVSAP